LLYTRYGWLKRHMMKRIVAKAGGDTDTTRDFEYTDWDDLRDFTQDFAKLAGRRPALSSPHDSRDPRGRFTFVVCQRRSPGGD